MEVLKMQCPGCDHEAPAAEFGDPLRCSNCGTYYEKAVIARAEQAAKRQASAVAAASVVRAKKRGRRTAAMAVVTVVSLCIALISLRKEFGFTGHDSHLDCSKASGYGIAQSVIKANLKYSSFTRFAELDDPDVTIWALGRCKYHVQSYADTPNLDGAMLRLSFSITVEKISGEDIWVGSESVMTAKRL